MGLLPARCCTQCIVHRFVCNMNPSSRSCAQQNDQFLLGRPGDGPSVVKGGKKVVKRGGGDGFTLMQ